jgi:N-acetylglucosamine-6-phosphate deacetylase
MEISAKYSFINGSFAKGEDNAEFDFLVPGFIDIHCHGGGGKYFSEDAPTAITAHRVAGTRVQIASLVTADIQTLISQIQYLKSQDIFGIHLEGPYLSPKYVGAHDPALLKQPTISEIEDLLAAGEGAIKMVTIAPELPGGIEAIDYLTKQGVVTAIGHSDAKAEDTKLAIAAGAKVVTHFNNAMAKLGEPDSLSQIAIESEIYLEQIQDGQHISHTDTVRIVNKAGDRIIAITDAMSAAGCADGIYKIGSLAVTVENKVAKLTGTNTLAGSTLTMLDAFLNFEKIVGFEKAVSYTSINPAKLLGVNPYDCYIAIKGREVIHL